MLFSNRRINREMKSVKFVLIILTTCAVSIKQMCAIRIDTMDSVDQRISLSDPRWPDYSSGILKSHSASYYTANRNKTVLLSAPEGYSIFAAVRLLDLRPNRVDYLTLIANQTTGPKTFSNSRSYQWKEYDPNENLKTYYAPDGQLDVNFFTGPDSTRGFGGFELMYTVQANWTKCGFSDFRCYNGRCVSRDFKCDGHNHCGDRSDQKNCYFPDPVRPSRRVNVAGIVGGMIFLLIAVACVIYVMIRRVNRRKIETRRIVNQHPPPTNIQGYPPPYPEPGMIYPPPPPPYSAYQGVTNPAYQ